MQRFNLGPEAVNQLRQLVSAEVKRLRVLNPGRGRWVKGGGGCRPQNCILQISVFGGPTGGTFDWNLTIDGTETALTFNYDDTAAEVATEIATHSKVTSDDITVTGGDFPDSTISVEFKGDLAKTDVAVPTADWSSLTGGSGVGVISSKTQVGHPL